LANDAESVSNNCCFRVESFPCDNWWIGRVGICCCGINVVVDVVVGTRTVVDIACCWTRFPIAVVVDSNGAVVVVVDGDSRRIICWKNTCCCGVNVPVVLVGINFADCCWGTLTTKAFKRACSVCCWVWDVDEESVRATSNVGRDKDGS
jgi:hypothetical protein